MSSYDAFTGTSYDPSSILVDAGLYAYSSGSELAGDDAAPGTTQVVISNTAQAEDASARGEAISACSLSMYLLRCARALVVDRLRRYRPVCVGGAQTKVQSGMCPSRRRWKSHLSSQRMLKQGYML